MGFGFRYYSRQWLGRARTQDVLTNSDDNATIDSNLQEKSHVPNVPKEGGIQGWVNVLAVFMFSACTWGVNGVS